MNKVSFLLVMLQLALSLQAQPNTPKRPIVKYGDITPEQVKTKSYDIDHDAEAVVLHHAGRATHRVDNRSNFNIAYKYHKRIHLLKKNSFDEATVKIPLYKQGDNEEFIQDLQAHTYTLSDGKIVATELDKAGIFKDKESKTKTVVKFTFPNLQEGCIIEYSYTLISPFETTLKSWYFQDINYPTLWSEYEISIPQLFTFLPVHQGNHSYTFNKSDAEYMSYTFVLSGDYAKSSEAVTYSGDNRVHTWGVSNKASLKPENFITAATNYISKVDFYLLYITYPGQEPKDMMTDWNEATDNLTKNQAFAAQVFDNNAWMDSEIKKISTDKDQLSRLKALYYWVRDNFTCTGDKYIWLDRPLKKVFQSKSGTSSEINLLLAAMLRKADFEACPLIISTRDNGRAYDTYPVIEDYNYVVVHVWLNGEKLNLDASDKTYGFSRLPSKCYNGYGHLISPIPASVLLSADSLHEKKETTISIKSYKDSLFIGTFTSTPGFFESQKLRHRFTSSLSFEENLKSNQTTLPYMVKPGSVMVNNINDREKCLTIDYEFIVNANDDVIYLNPLFAEATKTNPFSATQRLYPVEMPYVLEEIYTLNFVIPNGYAVEELPKPLNQTLNKKDGFFDYSVAVNNNVINVKSHIKLHKATFNPYDYKALRDFFATIVKKHNEQLVLKKIH